MSETTSTALPLQSVRLRRDYGDLIAVSDVSFDVPHQAIVALVGPNGAGKSTWLRMVAGLLEPTSGTARVFGLDVRERPRDVHEKVGFLPDFFGLYEDLRVGDFLEYFARAYGIPTSECRARVREVLENVRLADRINEPIGVLSRGMHQRLGIARTLISDPPLLLLDEPASGLDPEARHDLQVLFQNLAKAGKTLVVSSHILTELEEYCTHVAILDQGKLRAFGSVDEVHSQTRKGRKIRTRALSRQPDLIAFLRGNGSIVNVDETPDFVTFEWLGDEAGQADLLKQILGQGIPLSYFGEIEASIQDAYLSVLKEKR